MRMRTCLLVAMALTTLLAGSTALGDGVYPKERRSGDAARIRYGNLPSGWTADDVTNLVLGRHRDFSTVKADKHHTFNIDSDGKTIEAYIDYSVEECAWISFDIDPGRDLGTQAEIEAYHSDLVPDYVEREAERTYGKASLGGQEGYRVTDVYIDPPRWDDFQERVLGGEYETYTTYVLYVNKAPVTCRITIRGATCVVEHTPYLRGRVDLAPLAKDDEDLAKKMQSEADQVLASVQIVAAGEEFSEPAPTSTPDTPAGNNWVVVVGGVAAVGAAAAAIAAGAKALGAKKTGSKPRHDVAPVGYVLQLSSRKLSVTAAKPATLAVKAWSVGADGVPKAAPEALISIELPPSAELTVTPSTGQGELSASVSARAGAGPSQVTLTVSAEAGGGRVSDTVTVELQSSMELEFF